ncbi:restriction endonuclease subunit S [Fictibacillus sp. S7]|uniref:restriction endonuclease subunit S n=1 Tax=Fictibacillus sp. S7 TaxID=2212476 RepID=UPI0013E90145|nr:restriction endonuclease subunit S [Fictibacillus sp. S7]
MEYSIFGRISDNWKYCKIGDVVNLRQGLQISSKRRVSEELDGYIPLLKITDLPKGKFSEYVTDIKEQYVAVKEDIIYTRTGQVGLVYTDVEGCVHNNCFKVEYNSNQLDKMFLFYYLNNKYFKELANNVASGSVQKDLTHSSFKTLPFAFPEISLQKKISSILFSLDKKININLSINSDLEQIAQTLFKRWFIDFEFPNENGEPYQSSGGKMVESELGLIPEGWNVLNFNKFVQSISESINKKSKESAIFLNTSDILEGKVLKKSYSPTKEMPGQAKKLIKKNDILYSEIRPANKRFAYVDFDANDYVVSTKLMVLRADEDIFPSKVLYLYLKNEDTINKLQQIAETRSGTFPQITFKQLSQFIFAIPEKEQFTKNYAILKNIVDHQLSLMQEIERLKELRDILLPKLLSGEIEIPTESEELEHVQL